MTCIKYLFRISKGVYRVHPDVLDAESFINRLIYNMSGLQKLKCEKPRII